VESLNNTAPRPSVNTYPRLFLISRIIVFGPESGSETANLIRDRLLVGYSIGTEREESEPSSTRQQGTMSTETVTPETAP
jgi:hypothetical protein